MSSKYEINCFNKIINVCNNRGFPDIAQEIINQVAPKFLDKSIINNLTSPTFILNVPNKQNKLKIKSDLISRISFFQDTKFDKICECCSTVIEVGSPVFVKGNSSYHVLCGLDIFADKAANNAYYKRWVVSNRQIHEEKA